MVAKKEWDLKGNLVHDENLELTVVRSKKRVKIKYTDRGDTGIRNNGMTVEYQGTEKLKVQLGSVSGFGFIAHAAAGALIGDSMSIFDARALEGEIFTINRSGFGFLGLVLGLGLESAKTSAEGGFSLVTPGTCQVRYRPHLSGDRKVLLQPTDSIFELEEKLGTLAYIIWQENLTQFNSFRDVFVRQKPMEVSIPKSFYETEFQFSTITHLPERFQLFQQGRRLGDYHFTEVQAVN